jgi:hypothetical protein
MKYGANIVEKITRNSINLNSEIQPFLSNKVDYLSITLLLLKANIEKSSNFR